MDLDVRHLHLIAAVADVGSLTRAGDRLHLTQSALSHQLRDIEARLETPLFLRIGKRLVLTPAGERLLTAARDVLQRLEQTELDIRQMGRDRAGLLRLTTECYTCYHWLPALLTRYRRRFPRVEVRIDVDATGHPIEMPLAGRIDLALVSSPVRDRRLTAIPIFEDELVVISSASHPFAQRTHVKLADMRGQTLLVYPPKEESRVLNEVLLPAGAIPERIEEVQLTEAITELVKAGLGVSIIAKWAVQPLVASGALVARPLTARGFAGSGARPCRRISRKRTSSASSSICSDVTRRPSRHTRDGRRHDGRAAARLNPGAPFFAASQHSSRITAAKSSTSASICR